MRLSDSEMQSLEELKQSEFSEDVPYGRVIGSIANRETLAEQKEILVTGEGTQEGYADQNDRILSPRARIVCRPVGEDGEMIRGFSPDLVVLLTEVSDEVFENVIEPMRAEIVKLY